MNKFDETRVLVVGLAHLLAVWATCGLKEASAQTNGAAAGPVLAVKRLEPSLRPGYLRCEYLQNPLGVEIRYGPPRFFWTLESKQRAQKQLAYEILVSSTEATLRDGNGDAWDSGKVFSDKTIQIEYHGAALESNRRYWWKVRSWDEASGLASAWSTNAFFQTGLLHPSDWKETQWIGAAGYDRTKPSPVFRSPDFVLNKPVRRAVVCASAKGVYELWLNGRQVGDHVLAPEWTDYRKRIQYQCFDVTSMLLTGEGGRRNVIGALTGEGWWSDANAFPEMKQAAPYGTPSPQLALALKIENEDGTFVSLGTSDGWSCSTNGPVRQASLYGGEVYDGNAEGASTNWTWPGAKVACFTNSLTASNVVAAQMFSQPNEPIRVTEVLRPVDVWSCTNSLGRRVLVYDLGQNMVGWCAISLDVPGDVGGSRLVVRHAERLALDSRNYPVHHGTIDVHNLDYSLGEARQTDEYILSKERHQEFRPHFTYHGFRYVEVFAPSSVTVSNISLTGHVIHSSAPPTGEFDCSDARIARLMRNIRWTIRGNLYGVMTDAPQRAEREGYLGSEMLISQTACFEFDLAAFYTKWIRDIREAQDPGGGYAIYAPWNGNKYALWDPGWQVGGVVFPWQLYLNYGDTRMLAEHYASATNWGQYLSRACPGPDYVWRSLTNPAPAEAGNNISYGDWLNGDAFKEYPAKWASGGAHAGLGNFRGYGTAWAVYSAELLGSISRALQTQSHAAGNASESAFYAREAGQFSDTAANLRRAYTNDANGFVKHDAGGGIAAVDNDSQAACVMALYFNLVPEDQRKTVARSLVYGPHGIENYNKSFSASCTNHLSTGNQFAAREMLVLSQNGYAWKAFQVLTNADFPSWLYWVENGATTCWERWNSYLSGPGPGRGYADYNEPKRYSDRMSFNSFNSLPFGAVGEWIWEVVGGISPDAASPAYKHFWICPQSGANISWARSSVQTIQGEIVCAWTNDLLHTNCSIELKVPANTEASLFLPTTNLENIVESGCPALSAPGLLGNYFTNVCNWAGGATVLRLGSGEYQFHISNAVFEVAQASASGRPEMLRGHERAERTSAVAWAGCVGGLLCGGLLLACRGKGNRRLPRIAAGAQGNGEPSQEQQARD